MNQDFDKNDRQRDDAPRRNERSSGRRDDDRTGNSRPRLARDSDRNDRPRRNNDDKPRFSRDTNRPDERPRFERSNDRRDDKPRFNRDDKPRFGRDNDRQTNAPNRFNRDNDTNKPRFRRDERSEQPRPDRSSRDDKPRFNRDDKPRFSRDERPSRDDKPRFERSDNRPRFNRDDRPRQADNNRDEKPRFNRDSERTERPRFSRDNDRTDKPRFNRDDKPRFDRGGRDENPRFKRVGGFNREADERNRFESQNERRSEPRRNDDRTTTNRNDDESSRFTPAQRRASGDRRVGDYDKVPNYELAQRRHEQYGQDDRRGKKTSDKYRDKRDAKAAQPTDQPVRTAAQDGLIRLNRYIANSGVCSRREAEELILRGDITVNGKVITELGFKVKDGDTVKYGTKLLSQQRFVYVLLNKPKDYITTTDDPEDRRTVMELVADVGSYRIYPVGRLDRNTTGLLLLTNDGELADKLTHPSNEVKKIYQIEIDKSLTEEHFEAIRKGIELEDGPIKPDALSIVTPDAHVIGIEIHSGRNRIVRRIFEHFGYEVTRLDRTMFAGLTKKELPRGKWRFLDPKEVVKLKYLS
ncbi:pseudouridine synthase [Spirosoma montaniterrae]|uniref:Pseudouridine synthase n=1 Tax=Spirosoma montaniterrae TaxID=1178516 RepID=A0A1P9X3L5_9BACT|nr:pseudouridine synthase [Spirosoma montaniterrae]AQG82173.1 hypothetical protein AWR27_24490 [Spirosoma montaniterrae]